VAAALQAAQLVLTSSTHPLGFYLGHGRYVFIDGVSKFVCVSRIIRKHCSADFHKIWWKSGTQAPKEALNFDGNPDHVMLGIDRVMADLWIHVTGVEYLVLLQRLIFSTGRCSLVS